MVQMLVFAMGGALAVLLCYHAFIFSRLAVRRQVVTPDLDLPVSVVICARNEAPALEKLVPELMEQDHREFEVVVVNDRSQDLTGEVLEWMKPRFPRLRVVNIQADEKFSYGKKIAVGVGVRAAKHPHILLTDADCRPVGPDWISCMASGFSERRHIVIGHSPTEVRPGLTNLLERYDGITKAVQFIAFAKAGLPYMGVGRNLGYTHEVFFNAKGPRRHHHLMSGDDDLFINEVARARNTSAVADPRTFMVTRATEGLATWIRRKRRHYTTARYYRFGHQLLLTLLPLARLVFWVACAALFALGAVREAGAGLAVKVGAFLPVTLLAMRRLGAGPLLLTLALPLEWLFLVLEPLIYLSTLVIKPRRWK
ncbi:MAG TPA: glycosyltransferase [Flavobacteriales bacterium]|nr:glycosyltransferase [Flavobacteriales bacterium]HMR28187.1 glycosyltransferase [Flavobacteriales bacterium]